MTTVKQLIDLLSKVDPNYQISVKIVENPGTFVYLALDPRIDVTVTNGSCTITAS